MKSVRISPRRRRRVATTLASFVIPDIIPSRGCHRLSSPLNRFTEPRYLREHQFCGSILYWACNVTDLVAPGIEWYNAGADSWDEVGGGFGGHGGLTGWYLNLFMKIFFGGRCR